MASRIFHYSLHPTVNKIKMWGNNSHAKVKSHTGKKTRLTWSIIFSLKNLNFLKLPCHNQLYFIKNLKKKNMQYIKSDILAHIRVNSRSPSAVLAPRFPLARKPVCCDWPEILLRLEDIL